eukprot:2818224-Amphidinium_carterae.1
MKAVFGYKGFGQHRYTRRMHTEALGLTFEAFRGVAPTVAVSALSVAFSVPSTVPPHAGLEVNWVVLCGKHTPRALPGT